MPLFPEALVRDVRRLPGGGHSFLRQLVDDDGAPARARIQAVADAVGGPVADRWAEVLTSLDNRRFFQGFAEVSACGLLQAAGWHVADLAWPGPFLVARDHRGMPFHLLVLAFIRQSRPADRQAIERLTRTLDRTGSRSRIALLVRRWLPHDFDPEPVRRAVEMWLREVDRGTWDGRYASYEDEHVSLEFALTGESTGSRGVVAFAIGPFLAQRTLEVLERRLVYELDAYRMGPWSEQPVLVAAVANDPWHLTSGWVRELLYGKPVREEVGEEHTGLELTYGPDFAPCLFRDPLYRGVSGLLLVERPGQSDAAVTSRSYLNPWATRPLDPDALPSPTLAVRRWEGESPVLAWEGEE